MVTFIALYRGETPASARLVALTAEPEMVRDFARRMTGETDPRPTDAVLREVDEGRRRALKLVAGDEQ